MSTTPLLADLKARTLKGIENNKKKESIRLKQEEQIKYDRDLQLSTDIITQLPEDLKRVADGGEGEFEILVDIRPLHPDAVKKIEDFLKGLEIKTEQRPDSDPGSDREWTHIWAKWYP